MTKKVLIVGGGLSGSSVLAKFKEQYGEDVVLVTPEEALEQRIPQNEFINLPTLKITAPQILDQGEYIRPSNSYKDGKQLRRERRKKQKGSKR